MKPSDFRELRRSAGLTQEALAREMGVSLRLVCGMESGTHPIGVKYEFALRWIVLMRSKVSA